jgi:dihydrofolate reductase
LVAVVATLASGLMGREGGMPWRCPEDLKAFRRLTTGHAVIMGRTTYESIGRPLPKRLNIVLSRRPTPEGADPRVRYVGGKEAAIEMARPHGKPRAFIIGGLMIYRLFWDDVDAVVHSMIQAPELGEPTEEDLYFPIEDLMGEAFTLARTERFDTFTRRTFTRTRDHQTPA